MTSVIIPFVPKVRRPEQASFGSPIDWQLAALAAAHQNMQAFIDHVKSNAKFFGDGTGWSNLQWKFGSVRGRTSKDTCRFTEEPGGDTPFGLPFADQARAIVAEQYRYNNKTEPQKVLRALRILHRALQDEGKHPDLMLVDQHVIGKLSPYIEQYAKISWWQISRNLHHIINFILQDKGLTSLSVVYNSPYSFKSCVKRDNFTVENQKSDDQKGIFAKAKRLPHLNAIFDLASLFNNNAGILRNYNAVYTSFAALALFAPSRQAEIMTLPAKCITYADDERAGKPRLGLSWRPAKGGQPLTKFATSSDWEVVAGEAVQRLLILGKSARVAAKWYEENSDQLYLPPGTEHLRGQPLSWLEIQHILGWDPTDNLDLKAAFDMKRALHKVGDTDDPNRIGEAKEWKHTVGHLTLYTYDSVVALAKRRVFATNIKQGPKLAAARAWFRANPDRLRLPDRLTHLDGQPLTGPEIIEILQLYNDGIKIPKSKDQIRGRELLVSTGTTTDPNRGVRRISYDRAAEINTDRHENVYSQDSIRNFVRRFLADYIGPLPDHLQAAADWYQKHPDRLYLTGDMPRLGDDPLTLKEALSLIGLTERALEQPGSIRYITTDQMIAVGATTDPERGAPPLGRVYLYAFDDLEKLVLSRLQDRFPIIDPETDLTYSEALFCLPHNIQSADEATFWNVPFWVNYNSIITALSGQAFEGKSGPTIFSRNGLVNPATKKPWTLTTHQLRHLLNTLAQGRYLSQALIAFWSGRRSVAQNASYDHVPQEVFIEAWHLLEEQSGVDLKVTGSLDEKAASRAIKEGISYREALALEIGAIHVTRYGLCRHDYSLTPCPKDKNCIDCGETLLVAHDERMIVEAEFQIQIHQNAIAECIKAIQNIEPGVKRWMRIHETKLSRWTLALELMTDENTEPGTLITLPPPADDQSKTGLVMDQVSAENGESSLDPSPSINDQSEEIDMDDMFNFGGDGA